MKLYEELVWRGLVKDSAGEDLREKLNDEVVTFYWGTDPTADSLHLGHYSSLVTAKRLANAGHNPILLIGGATGLIGDPRPTAERDIITRESLNKNMDGIKKQIEKIFEGKAEVVDNYDWMKGYDFVDFLRDVGKYVNVNYMLSKDIIKRRLDTGITFAEFAYTLIQGYDFLYLFENKNCIMQVEGSDQWGNITTGLELIKKKTGKEGYAFTMPLVTDKSGNKFGKSEGNALWLDINKTSSYELYQYLVNVDDEMVIDYLKIFTYLSVDEINKLEQENIKNPHLREAHKALAHGIITEIHGIKEYEKALKISKALFKGDIPSLNIEEIRDIKNSVPNFKVEKELNLVAFLVEYNIATSNREAREFINNNSISINGTKVNDLDYIVNKECAINNELVVIRKGKKKYFIGEF